MLQRLLKLYNKQHQSGKTPLEDFTTEALVGLLETDKKLLQVFCKDFLKLKSEHFSISSQRKYPLKDEHDCIIDIVIEGENEICFIENKVNSSEGYKQISRYCMILDEYKQNNQEFDTKMVYCTQFSEPKEENSHGFIEIKWYEIAHFLKKHLNKYPTIKLFIDFLKSKNMDQDLTITAIDLITIQNYTRATELMKGHLESANPFFEKTISKKKLKKRLEIECNRYSHLMENDGIVILYYISFEGKMHVDIWLPNTHPKSVLFKDCAKKYLPTPENNGLGLWEDENSSCICVSKPLSAFLDDEQGDIKILEWFEYAFNEIKKFIDFSKAEIDWNI